jgi:hypothetical protein
MKQFLKIILFISFSSVLMLIACSSTEIPHGNSKANDLTRDILLPMTDYSMYALVGPYEDLWFVLDSLNGGQTRGSFSADDLMKVDSAKIIVRKDLLQTYGNIQVNNSIDAKKIESYFQTESASRTLFRNEHTHEIDLIFDNSSSRSSNLESIGIKKYITLNEFDPDGLRLMSNLPNEPSLELVGVGAISKDMKAISMLTNVDDLDLQFITRTYKTLNGGNVVFGAYTSGNAKITFHPESEFFQDSMRGLVLITHSTYASPLVSFLVREISEDMGMRNLLVKNSNVRHLELEGVHVIVKNVGSLVYLVISNDLRQAEKLIGSILPVP